MAIRFRRLEGRASKPAIATKSHFFLQTPLKLAHSLFTGRNKNPFSLSLSTFLGLPSVGRDQERRKAGSPPRSLSHRRRRRRSRHDRDQLAGKRERERERERQRLFDRPRSQRGTLSLFFIFSHLSRFRSPLFFPTKKTEQARRGSCCCCCCCCKDGHSDPREKGPRDSRCC